MLSTRDRNKHLRRARILEAAGQILAEQGFDALTTRGLAEAADVTVPTIYNLIGGKDDILRALVADSVERIWELLELPAEGASIDVVEDMIGRCLQVVEEDQGTLRAAIIAADRVADAYSAESEAGVRSVGIPTATVEVLQSSGVLLGNIAAEALGEQMFSCFHDPFREWGYDLISFEEFRRRALRGCYMVLCADATDTARRELVARINALQVKGSEPARRAAPGS